MSAQDKINALVIVLMLVGAAAGLGLAGCLVLAAKLGRERRYACQLNDEIDRLKPIARGSVARTDARRAGR